MKFYKIDKAVWSAGLEKLRDHYQLFGPAREGNFSQFIALDDGRGPELDLSNTHLSPKSIVHPQSEVMFEYTLDSTRDDHHVLRPVEKDGPPQAVMGIRPCDAKAFLLVRRNFDAPGCQDPYWLKAYEGVTFVGLACQTPCKACFCTTAGCGPFHEEGLDLLLVQEREHYLVKVITGKGDALLEAAGWDVAPGSDSAHDDMEKMKAAAEAKIQTFVNTDRLKDQVTTDLYDAPFWEDVSFSCINCGTCTYVCPTCWCFDIQDETRGKSGTRMRNWDSCMYPLFTMHGTGHNPRGKKVQRVRQRFMHKLKYYVDKYDGQIQCVGCGRCVNLCPVNIDIRKVCEKMNHYIPQQAG
ncbi:MAG: 4Fe-4S dicluster domain-containing protein [Desulfobacterales bacterium]|nr:4Fe-4S dicluster domain-containing protein [Desulfobacterales bacterium]